MYAKLDNTQSKLNFAVKTCKLRYWIAFSGARERSI